MPVSITEKLSYSTVRIECDYKDGGRGTGTGFFFRFLERGSTHIPAIVTNWHVVEGAQVGRFQVHLDDGTGGPSGQHVTVELPDFATRWIRHPDKGIDLAIMPTAPLHREAEAKGKKIWIIPLDRSLIPTLADLDDLATVEDIIMVGYPAGIWDPLNNMPIFRRGISATHPRLDYNGRSEFVVDAACFPGSSGSPILLLNEGMYCKKDGGTVIGTRFKLLGVLYAGPQYMADGTIQVVDVPTQQRAISKTSIPSNLGFVIKAQRILDFEEPLKPLLPPADPTSGS